MKNKFLYFIISVLSLLILLLTYILFGIQIYKFITNPLGFSDDVYLWYKGVTACNKGERISDFDEYPDGTIIITGCEKDIDCVPGDELQINCGALPTKTSCSYTCRGINEPHFLLKPVIYLYTQTPTDVKVELKLAGKIIADYPKYDYSLSGWYVKANPDGNIFNYADNKNYNYLFWEGELTQNHNWNLDKGFVVKGENIRDFLENILPKIGLSDKESDDFITYWYPKLQTNKYNLIHFSTKEYTDLAPLKTSPNYDSILRVFMVTKALDKPINIQKQDFLKFERKGFSVVEWGGTIVK